MIPDTTQVERIRNLISNTLFRLNIGFNTTERGEYTFRQGSTAVVIRLIAKDNDIFAYVFSPVAMDVTRLNLELLIFLMAENHKLHLCKFSLEAESRSIWLEHSLLGSTLNEQELIRTLEIIALTADRYDEQISLMSGGKRATDI